MFIHLYIQEPKTMYKLACYVPLTYSYLRIAIDYTNELTRQLWSEMDGFLITLQCLINSLLVLEKDGTKVKEILK